VSVGEDLDEAEVAGVGSPGSPGSPRSPGSPQGPRAQPVPGAGPRAGRRRSGFPWRLAVVGAALLGALGFLIFKGLSGSLDYFETVDQAISHKAMLGTQTFRLEGLVLPGTVHRTRAGVSFVAAGTHHRIDVTNVGNPPQLFQPDIPVVVVGHFSGDGFVSNQIIVDHTAQYIEEYPKRVEAPNGTRR
jgi:cytochrome c-type biogenesis protein CcmE